MIRGSLADHMREELDSRFCFCVFARVGAAFWQVLEEVGPVIDGENGERFGVFGRCDNIDSVGNEGAFEFFEFEAGGREGLRKGEILAAAGHVRRGIRM